MPIRPKAEKAGVFRPSDLALLGRVFDRLEVEGQSSRTTCSSVIHGRDAGCANK